MNQVVKGFMMGVLFCLLFLFGYAWGIEEITRQTKKDCELLGSFRADGVVYLCQKMAVEEK